MRSADFRSIILALLCAFSKPVLAMTPSPFASNESGDQEEFQNKPGRSEDDLVLASISDQIPTENSSLSSGPSVRYPSGSKESKISSQSLKNPKTRSLKSKKKAKLLRRSQLRRALKSKGYERVNFPQFALTDPLGAELNSLLPKSLAPTLSPQDVFTKMGDQALQNWVSSESVKSSVIGRNATLVESAMKTEVVLGESENRGVDHRVSMQYLALQSTAKLEYKGWVNASLNYNSSASETEVEVREKLWRNKDLYLNHKVTAAEGKSSVGLQWAW